MSSARFFPTRWNINPSWTHISSSGRSEFGFPVHVMLKNEPYLTLLYSNDDFYELDSFVSNGVILKSPENVSPGLYRVFFSDKNGLELFLQEYNGTADIVQTHPLRSFFISKRIQPGNWQEILNIKTPPESQDSTNLEFYSESISSLEVTEPKSLNLFLVADKGLVTLTIDFQGQTRNHSFDTWTSEVIRIVQEYGPNRIIYYVPDGIPSLEFGSRAAFIRWNQLDLSTPENSSDMHRLWSLLKCEEKIRSLSNFWKQDITEHLSNSEQEEATDLIRTIDPLFTPKPNGTKIQGIFRDPWLTPIEKNFSVSPPVQKYFLNSGFEYLLTELTYPRSNDLLWISPQFIATRTPIDINSQKQLLIIIGGPDRILIDIHGKIHRTGLGSITYPPFRLLNKYFLSAVESLLHGRTSVSVPPAIEEDFIITKFISSSTISTVETDKLLARQLQELGKMPVKFRQLVSYIQTTSGPVLMTLVEKDPKRYFSMLDLDYYTNEIYKNLSRLF